MPGHMLLAERCPYDQVFEMEDINSEFGQTDVVLVLGAGVVNPAAKNDPKSPIAGMPILEAYKARTVIVNKRSMASGCRAGQRLFYMDRTMMVFGDAKARGHGEGGRIDRRPGCPPDAGPGWGHVFQRRPTGG